MSCTIVLSRIKYRNPGKAGWAPTNKVHTHPVNVCDVRCLPWNTSLVTVDGDDDNVSCEEWELKSALSASGSSRYTGKVLYELGRLPINYCTRTARSAVMYVEYEPAVKNGSTAAAVHW